MPDTFRVAADRTFLNAADWNPQKNISVRSDCDGLTVSSDVPTPWTHAVTSRKTVPVRPGNLLKATTKYYLLDAPSGSKFTLLVQLLDANGRIIKTMNAASGADKPPEHLNWDEEYTEIPKGCVSARAQLLFQAIP